MPDFHVMAKPIGPRCNLDCRYCFYLEKEALYPGAHSWRMSDDLLERYIAEYLGAHRREHGPAVSFAWQGGEPTLLGLDFFRRVVELQRKHCPPGLSVENAFQSNGVLIDDDWARFLAQHRFLVGISVDGPAEIHDRFRVDKHGQGTHARVMAAIGRLARHGAEFNTLTVVNRLNSLYPEAVYRFLTGIGSRFLQFIPLVEREAPAGSGLSLAEPPDAQPGGCPVTPWSVLPEAWGRFLCGVFDQWLARDLGRIFVQVFEVQLGILAGGPAGLCVFAERCGRGLALEHNGDLYSCDHYVYPQYRLGRIGEQPLAAMVELPQQRRFGEAKAELPAYCRTCPELRQCWGECPKHRFATTPDGEPGLNWLCAGYRAFFRHSRPRFDRILALLRAGRDPRELLRPPAPPAGPARPGPNAPCPCGSGVKYKKCCGR